MDSSGSNRHFNRGKHDRGLKGSVPHHHRRPVVLSQSTDARVESSFKIVLSSSCFTASNQSFNGDEGAILLKDVFHPFNKSLDWNRILFVVTSVRDTCHICLETPVSPFVLRCGHIVCGPCYLQLLNTLKQTTADDVLISLLTKGGITVSCPCCNESFDCKYTRPVLFVPPWSKLKSSIRDDMELLNGETLSTFSNLGKLFDRSFKNSSSVPDHAFIPYTETLYATNALKNSNNSKFSVLFSRVEFESSPTSDNSKSASSSQPSSGLHLTSNPVSSSSFSPQVNINDYFSLNDYAGQFLSGFVRGTCASISELAEQHRASLLALSSELEVLMNENASRLSVAAAAALNAPHIQTDLLSPAALHVQLTPTSTARSHVGPVNHLGSGNSRAFSAALEVALSGQSEAIAVASGSAPTSVWSSRQKWGPTAASSSSSKGNSSLLNSDKLSKPVEKLKSPVVVNEKSIVDSNRFITIGQNAPDSDVIGSASASTVISQAKISSPPTGSQNSQIPSNGQSSGGKKLYSVAAAAGEPPEDPQVRIQALLGHAATVYREPEKWASNARRMGVSSEDIEDVLLMGEVHHDLSVRLQRCQALLAYIEQWRASAESSLASRDSSSSLNDLQKSSTIPTQWVRPKVSSTATADPSSPISSSSPKLTGLGSRSLVGGSGSSSLDSTLVSNATSSVSSPSVVSERFVSFVGSLGFHEYIYLRASEASLILSAASDVNMLLAPVSSIDRVTIPATDSLRQPGSSGVVFSSDPVLRRLPPGSKVLVASIDIPSVRVFCANGGDSSSAGPAESLGTQLQCLHSRLFLEDWPQNLQILSPVSPLVIGAGGVKEWQDNFGKLLDRMTPLWIPKGQALSNVLGRQEIVKGIASSFVTGKKHDKSSSHHHQGGPSYQKQSHSQQVDRSRNKNSSSNQSQDHGHMNRSNDGRREERVDFGVSNVAGRHSFPQYGSHKSFRSKGQLPSGNTERDT